MTIKQTLAEQEVRDKVRAGYAAIAVSDAAPAGEGCGCGPTSCCSADGRSEAEQLAAAIGYEAADLAATPQGANMGLSCGNPTALAGLRPGEVVLDLGSGGGFDVFIAGRRVGARGRAIGVDMTPEMLAKARRNAVAYHQQTGLDNVEFRLGEIEHLPVADNSVDVVISNCVLNLSPNKRQVWREISRVLRPGGRVAVSDIALKQPLPESIRSMVEALVGCVAGAITIAETERLMHAAGLDDVEIVAKDAYIDAMTDWNDPLYAKIVSALPAGAKASDYITSADISATKPRAANPRCC
jgi:ubiquinone/menaquinone biosynthesis C-methylase UbiE